jgi:hypothetical protein
MIMTQARAAWPASSILTMAFGCLLVLAGFYFLFLRPALLPEDLRYIGVVQPQLEASAPQLALWLKHVFWVMGGYVTATGLLTAALAATALRERNPIAAIGLFAGGFASIGLMVLVNFIIDSDFKWQLASIGFVWAAGMVCFWIEGRSRRESVV